MDADARTLKGFLHRHSRLLVVVGTFIVFLTFLVDQVYRERLKDLIASTNAEEQLFLLRGDTLRLEEALDILQGHAGFRTECGVLVERLSASNHRPVVSLEPCSSMEDKNKYQLNTEIQTAWTEAYQSMQVIRRLADKLPWSPQRQDALKRYSEQLSKINSLKSQTSESAKQDYQFAFAQLILINYDLQNSTNELSKTANDLIDQREKRERKLRHCSYVLYGLGWLLASLGKLYHIEGLA